MNKVSITIDGSTIEATPGNSVLEEALANGIDIPHLCYDPRLRPSGSCRLCFVEVTGQPAPVPSCSLAVADGMDIITNSTDIRSLRKMALELLMSEHCGDCIAPCTIACPAGIDVQGFVAHLNNGEYDQASLLIREKMPLPSICGRVCPRFCERQCRRNLVDDAVDVCGLKRFSGDHWLDQLQHTKPTVAADSGYQVAVVGGGPAGLTAAYFLALQGHQITLFDTGPKLGGMLRYGIPEYRLPEALLDQEIDVITDLCHEIHLGKQLGRDFTLAQLQSTFDAVFLSIGCQEAQALGVPNQDLPGIHTGIGFLRDVVMGNAPDVGDTVAVFGGGNTAMDAARTAVRLGAKRVLVIYRRSREEMPAEPIEIEEAMEEGVEFHFLTNPRAFGGHGRVQEVECVRMQLGEPDSSGRRRPVEIPDSEFTIPIDTAILAIGQKVDATLSATLSLPLERWGTFQVSSADNSPSQPNVFVAGDCVSGAATVVEAVGGARQAAFHLDRFLKGQTHHAANGGASEPFSISRGTLEQLNPDEFCSKQRIPRTHAEHRPAQERKTSFQEYAEGLAPEQVKAESQRCLGCGCLDANQCYLRELATAYQVSCQFGTDEKRYEVNKSHPHIHHDPNKCILCGKCVQICQDVAAASSWGFVNRGYDTVVKPALDLPLADVCESCGNCISVCPTGALTMHLPWVTRGPWSNTRVVETTCLFCDTNCALELHMAGDTLVNVTSPLRHPVSEGTLCHRGVFGYESVYDQARPRKPLVKREVGLQEASWDMAITEAAEALQRLVDRDGPTSVAVLVSPRLTNEEFYLAQQIAQKGLRTTHFGSTIPLLHSEKAVRGQDGMGITGAGISSSDFVLVIDMDLHNEYPITAHRVRQSVANGGKLVVISEQPTKLAPYATTHLPLDGRSSEQILLDMTAYVKQLLGGQADPQSQDSRKPAESMQEVMEQFVQAQRPVIIVNGETMSETEFSVLEDLVTITDNNQPGQGILAMHHGGNTYGQLAISGYSLPKMKGQIDDKLRLGTLRGVLVVGDDSILDRIAGDVFTVAISATPPADPNSIDVLLPAATFVESKGTVVNCEGRLQSVNPAQQPPGEKTNWQILSELSVALGLPQENNIDDVSAKLRASHGWQD